MSSSNKVPILMYHSIIDNDEHSISIESFKKQMHLMKTMGYQTIKFDELKKNNEKKFIITFDDAYENVFINAFPILRKLGFNAVCFIVANKIGHYNDWDKNKNKFKKMKIMNFEQINEWLKNGFSIGSHTLDHADLTKLNRNDKIDQIVNSKKHLNRLFNTEINTFAFPFGSYDDETQNIINEYYDYAVTTKRSRFIKNKFNNRLLPRVPVSKNDNFFKFFLKIKTPYEDMKFKE
jgi:peptidoglycan/xylan/chitin deacetylase (PgdA/CDA1 family)